MGYTDRFKSRMEVNGLSQFDRAMNTKKRSFNKYFKGALNKELVVIDGVEQYATFQDQNQNNNKDLSDDKYIIVESKSGMATGSQVLWRGHYWLVFSEEHKTVPTHKQGKIRATNHQIKWMVGDKICGNGNGYPAYVQNNTLYTLGVATSGQNAWVVNAKYGMYMKDSDEARLIKIGQRVFIGGNVYQVMFKDFVARRGLISFLLEEEFFNPNKDNAELGIADYYDAIHKEDPIVSPDTKEVVIKGSETAKIGSLVTYEAHFLQNGTEQQANITEWTISDTERVATIVEQSPTSVKIRYESNFQKVGSIISIIGKNSDGTLGSKTVKIISPY